MTSAESNSLLVRPAASDTSLDRLFRNARLPQWLLLLSGLVIALLAHPYVNPWTLTSWIGLLVVLLLSRQLLIGAYFRCSAEARRQSRWLWLMHLGNLLSGLCLATVHTLLIPLDSFPLQGPTYAITTGVSLCIAVVYASHFRVFLSFALPAWLPPTLYLLWQDDPSSPYWAVMGITVFGCLLLAVAYINRAAHAVNLSRLRNEALLRRLDASRLEAEQLNRQLSGEVQQRREAEQQLRHSHDQLEQRVRQRTAELERTSQDLSASKAQLQLALEASDLGLWDWNLQTDRVFHSHLQAIFGLPEDSVLSMRRDLNPRIHPDDLPLVRSTLIAHMKGRTDSYRIEYRVRHASGHWLWIEDSGRAVERDSQGRVLRMTGTRRDISERQARQESDRLAATVFNTAAEGIFVLDAQLRILTVNQAFTRITGYPAELVTGQPLEKIALTPDYLAELQKILSQLQVLDNWQGELQACHRDGHVYPQWLQLRAVRDGAGQLNQLVGFLLDLTDQHQTEEQLRQLANYDSLTRLANRSLFTRRLHEAVQRANRQQHRLAMLHLNLDRFKLINETLGHELADQLLAETGSRLLNSLPQAHTLARLAADEFVIMFDQSLSREQLAALAEQLLQELHRPLLMDSHELMITASIGISLFPETAADAPALMSQASLAMQHAKRQGGNDFAFFSEAIQAGSLLRLQREQQLRRALQDQQLRVHYQPRLRLADSRLCAAEALVRWQHPQDGLLLPGEFIEITEQTGMIISLGEQVLRQACQQASAWQQQGLAGVGVSVNLSVQQLRQSGFATLVADCLAESSLPASLLELELTESMLMEQQPTIAENIRAIKAMGVRLAVDDFGTGYSSLAYLKRFPIDTLKIDRAFVAELQHGEEDRAIVRAIILMAQSLKLEVVAEGVEHAEQLELLRQFGCDEIQGFLLSRALPLEQLLELQTCPVL